MTAPEQVDGSPAGRPGRDAVSTPEGTAGSPAGRVDGSVDASPRRVDGVLFDVDDTLVDTAGAFSAALRAVAREHLPHLDAGRLPEVLAAWRADVGGHYARYTSGEVDYRTQRMARANELHAAFGGQPLDDSAYEAWNSMFEAGFSGAWTAHGEVVAVLDALRGHGVAVGALSNASVAYQTSKLVAVGLGERMPLLVGVDSLGVGKPDPRVFLEACSRLGTEPARTAYVGDELDVDARAAVAAGLIGVWVDRPGPRRVDIADADITAARDAGVLVISSLSELPEALGL